MMRGIACLLVVPGFCLGALAVGGPRAAPASSAQRAGPNVVVFLVDDQGYGDLGYHGNPHAKTPQLDTFAAEAVELANFHVSPVCAPTRASLMTGRYNFRTRVCDVFGGGCQMDPAETTVAQSLRAAGYATGIFGKWHLGDTPDRCPGAKGFDESLTFPGAAMRAGQYFNPELLHNGVKERREGYCMDVFTVAAVEFIKKNRDRPFFVYLAPNLIHVPLVVDEELAAPYAAMGLGPQTSKIYGMLRSVDDNFGRLRATLKHLGLEENTLLIVTSDNGPCSGSVPTNRFMAGLHGLKGTVYENGIRVPCFARWPAGFKSPAKVTRLTAHIDVMPTILAACGVNRPDPAKTSSQNPGRRSSELVASNGSGIGSKGPSQNPVRRPSEPAASDGSGRGSRLDGTSLLPLLRNPAADWPQRTLFFQWDSGQTPRRGHAWCAVTERWKLVQPVGMDAPNQKHIRDRYAELCAIQGRGPRSIEGQPRYELYDLAADPGETKDLAADHRDVVETMKGLYEAWFDDVCAGWPAPAQAQPSLK